MLAMFFILSYWWVVSCPQSEFIPPGISPLPILISSCLDSSGRARMHPDNEGCTFWGWRSFNHPVTNLSHHFQISPKNLLWWTAVSFSTYKDTEWQIAGRKTKFKALCSWNSMTAAGSRHCKTVLAANSPFTGNKHIYGSLKCPLGVADCFLQAGMKVGSTEGLKPLRAH